MLTNILPRPAFAQPSCHDVHMKGSWAARQIASLGEHVGAGAEDDVRPHSSIPGKSSRRHDLAYRVGVSPSSLSGIQEFYMDGMGASVSQRYTTDDVPSPVLLHVGTQRRHVHVQWCQVDCRILLAKVL